MNGEISHPLLQNILMYRKTTKPGTLQPKHMIKLALYVKDFEFSHKKIFIHRKWKESFEGVQLRFNVPSLVVLQYM